MNPESKGKAWYGKIYRKLETILVEVDNLAAQGRARGSLDSSDPPGLDSVRDGKEEKLTEDNLDIEQQSYELALQKCESASDISADQKFDVLQMEGDSLKEKLSDSVLIDENLEERSDCDQTATTSPESVMTAVKCNDDTFVSPSGISTVNPNLIPLATEIQAALVQDKVANIRSFSSNSMKVTQDEFFIEDFDAAPLDTIDLYDMTAREDPSDFDDDLLYAARGRTKQLRSFKRKVMDALTSKRRREKEYEQLAIWFGDADMGCDLINTKELATTYATTCLDSKSSQSNAEDSEWELL